MATTEIVKRSLADIERELEMAAERVMDLQDRLDAGETLDPAEYDAALVPFNEYLTLAKAKRDRFAEFILFLDSQESMYAERMRLDGKRKKAVANLAQRLRDMALYVLDATGSVKLEGEARTMSQQRNSVEALVIKDENKLPDCCFRMERVLDREAVKSYIRRGEIPADVAELVRGRHLRIR